MTKEHIVKDEHGTQTAKVTIDIDGDVNIEDAHTGLVILLFDRTSVRGLIDALQTVLRDPRAFGGR